MSKIAATKSGKAKADRGIRSTFTVSLPINTYLFWTTSLKEWCKKNRVTVAFILEPRPRGENLRMYSQQHSETYRNESTRVGYHWISIYHLLKLPSIDMQTTSERGDNDDDIS